MEEPTPVQSEEGQHGCVCVQICCKEVGHVTPFYDWSNERPCTSVPELPAGFEEFIGTFDEDPCLGEEELLREEESPQRDRETWRIGPPMRVACIPGARGCPLSPDEWNAS